ncbi:unnamed protein product, partial [Mesorhabditis belari]|uniref:Integrase catalytic domain-containing protein n=1 Tax=Mesorhabditis belari TaxID=2138241 RepID=A0AAF3FEA6_9BILA
MEVAEHVVSIFGTFGSPRILQTDNGREFANKHLEDTVTQWPGCKIVHGKPRHLQSQGSVERANADIEDIISAHQRENKTIEWVRFLPLHQYTKNIRFHSGINRSPYAAMFGQEPEDDATIVNDEIAPTSEDDALEQTINAAENILEGNSTRYTDLSFTDSIEENVEEVSAVGEADFQLTLGAILGGQIVEERVEIDRRHDSILMERQGARLFLYFAQLMLDKTWCCRFQMSIAPRSALETCSESLQALMTVSTPSAHKMGVKVTAIACA